MTTKELTELLSDHLGQIVTSAGAEVEGIVLLAVTKDVVLPLMATRPMDSRAERAELAVYVSTAALGALRLVAEGAQLARDDVKSK